jgi:Arc/MetJ-type ribon-helix-helix transcriptional regulator
MATKQHNVRLSDNLAAAIDRAAAERGYESVSAFMRHAIQKELRHDENAVAEVEERIAATLNRQAKELRSLHTAQLATFAYVDALTKVLLTCIAEPPNDVIDQAKARAKRRYQKFLISVAQNMATDARATLREFDRIETE